MTTLDNFFADFSARLDLDIYKRVQRGALMLAQELAKAWTEAITVSRGSRGAIGAIDWRASRKPQVAQAFVTIGKAGEYLQYLNSGVKPWPGAEFPGYSKMPPVDPLRRWVVEGNIPIPERFQAASDPARSFAFAIARTLKAKGRPALRIIEQTIEAHRGRLKSIIEGGTA